MHHHFFVFLNIDYKKEMRHQILLFLVDGAGGNAQHTTTKNTAALDRETEELHHEKVKLSVARAIQQGRQAKGLTQKELATVRLTGL